MYKKIYQFNEDYKVIKIWNSIHACVKTKQYTELAIKKAIIEYLMTIINIS